MAAETTPLRQTDPKLRGRLRTPRAPRQGSAIGHRSATRLGLAAFGLASAATLAACGLPGAAGAPQDPQAAHGEASDVLLLHSPTSFIAQDAPWAIRASLVCKPDLADGATSLVPEEDSSCARVNVTIVGGVVGDPVGQKVIWEGTDESLEYQTAGPELAADQAFSYHFEATTPSGASVRVPASGEFTTTAVSDESSDTSIVDADLIGPARSVFLPFSDDPSALGGTFIEGAFPAVPSSFAVTPNGTVAVADWMKSRVALYSPDGAFLSSLPGLERPTDMAALSDSSMLLVTLGSGGAAYHTSTEQQSPEPVGDLGGVTVRAASRSGQAWVETDPGQWQQFTADGGGATAAGNLPVGGDGEGAVLETSQVGTKGRLAVQGAKSAAATAVDLNGMSLANPVLAERTSDGGLVVAAPVWSSDTDWLLVLVQDADGHLVKTLHLPTHSIYLDSGFSGVRWDEATEQIAVVTDISPQGMQIDWFDTK